MENQPEKPTGEPPGWARCGVSLEDFPWGLLAPSEPWKREESQEEAWGKVREPPHLPEEEGQRHLLQEASQGLAFCLKQESSSNPSS